MSAAHNAYRLHGLGPCWLQESTCVASVPEVGGPMLKALAAASLLLKPKGIATEYFGFTGEDGAGSQLRRSLLHLPIDLSHFRRYPGPSSRDLGKGADPSALEFLFDRASSISEWPEPSFYQASWTWLEIPPEPRWVLLAAETLERAHRREAFTGIWVQATPNQTETYAPLEKRATDVCDLAIIDDRRSQGFLTSDSERESWTKGFSGFKSVVVLQDSQILYQSHGGILGKCSGSCAIPKEMDFSLAMGAMMAFFLQEIMKEDDLSRVEVHVNRERLEMQPLHLGMAIEWAILAASLGQLTEAKMATEVGKGEWLKQIHQAWRIRYPERFAIWGGRRESQR